MDDHNSAVGIIGVFISDSIIRLESHSVSWIVPKSSIMVVLSSICLMSVCDILSRFVLLRCCVVADNASRCVEFAGELVDDGQFIHLSESSMSFSDIYVSAGSVKSLSSISPVVRSLSHPIFMGLGDGVLELIVVLF